MAGEIQRTTKLAWARAGSQILVQINEVIDQVGRTAIENIQTIGATSEAIILGDVTTPKYIMFKNETDKWSALTAAQQVASGYATNALYDAAYTVYVSTLTPAVKDATSAVILVPGQGVSLISPATAWYAIAQTASVNLLVAAVQA